MPRKRMIDPKIWDDPDLARVTPAERLLFLGFISLADDYGHLSANPLQLRKWVFGYDNMTVDEVRDMRDHIVDACHNVSLYMVDGQEYIWLATWERQQDLRWRSKGDCPCHACGAYHEAKSWGECKTLPVNADYLTQALRSSCVELAQIHAPREEKRREESKSSYAGGADAPAERTPNPERPKPAGKTATDGEDRQWWAVMTKVYHFAPNVKNDNARGAWNKSIVVFRAAGAKPDEYPEIYQLYKKIYPGVADTPPAIAKYVDQLVGILRGTVPMPEREQRGNRRPEPTAPVEYVN